MATAKLKSGPKAKEAPASKEAQASKVDPAKSKAGTAKKGMPGVTPHLVCAGAAKAIDFYKKAFGAVERMRFEGPDGKMWHACVEIAGSPVMLVDEAPEWGSFGPKTLKGSPVTIHVNVGDVDAFIERAVAAGAKLKMPPADMFWGDRYGQVEDPFGHRWSVATHIRDMTPEEIRAAVPKGAPDCG